MTAPICPEGVTLRTPDGTDHPVTLTYVGVRDRDLIHVWHADAVIPLDQPFSIHARVIPAKTLIQFHARTTGDPA